MLTNLHKSWVNISTHFILLLPFFFSFINTCYAQEKLRIVTDDYPPYTSINNRGSGAILDIVKKAFEIAGIDVIYEFYPWKRCELNVEKGEVFAAVPYFKTDERKKKYNFSAPIIYSYNRFFYNKDKFPSGLDWNGLKDFKPYLMGGILGYWYIPEFNKNELKVTYSVTDEKNLLLLIHQRIDFTIIDELTGFKLLREKFPDDLHRIGILEKPESVLKFHLMISRKYPDNAELTEKFNNGLATIIDNAVYSKILQKYAIPDYFSIN